jgi:hypothetical protein
MNRRTILGGLAVMMLFLPIAGVLLSGVVRWAWPPPTYFAAAIHEAAALGNVQDIRWAVRWGPQAVTLKKNEAYCRFQLTTFAS